MEAQFELMSLEDEVFLCDVEEETLQDIFTAYTWHSQVEGIASLVQEICTSPSSL